jgi:hypothetical protein
MISEVYNWFLIVWTIECDSFNKVFNNFVLCQVNQTLLKSQAVSRRMIELTSMLENVLLHFFLDEIDLFYGTMILN